MGGLACAGCGSVGCRVATVLLQVCYLNPNVYSRYRVFFMRSGFRVVDCPPLTAQGKTSADIQIVLDVVDALGHETRYDEFVIASADADFTPLLYRLRAHDRRTTVVTAGPASAAYRSVCDSVILPDRFAEAVMGTVAEEADAPPPAGGTGVTRDAAQPSTPAAGPSLDRSLQIAAAVEALRAAVAAAPGPLVSASAAHAARAAYPEITADGWAGAGTFSAFVGQFAPELGWVRHPSPGYLYDPQRYSEADLPHAADERPARKLDPLAEQIGRVTGTPRLTSHQYAVLFEELARNVDNGPFVFSETSKVVRDRSVERGQPVSRAAVNFVLQGLIYSGYGLPSGSTAHTLAEAFANSVRTLCRNAQMELRDKDAAAIQAWFTSALAD